MRQVFHPHVPPRFDLWAAQRTIRSYKFPRSVLRKAKEFMSDDRDARVMQHLRALFESLTWADFAWRDQESGGDVYGKVDKYGLWYVKFEQNPSLRVMSMHEAVNHMTLYNGANRQRTP